MAFLAMPGPASMRPVQSYGAYSYPTMPTYGGYARPAYSAFGQISARPAYSAFGQISQPSPLGGTTRVITTASRATPSQAPVYYTMPNNPLKIGATFPNFEVQTTKGDFLLHDWMTADESMPWTIFFSHPADFTPVCTTELGACHNRAAQFAKLGAKLIGVSCDDVEQHHAWSIDVLARAKAEGTELNFPIIADKSRAIVTELGMLDPEETNAAGLPLPARALVILHGTTVKLTILYPATTGRNFDEVLRTLVSLQLTANNGLATPVDWKYNERVIVGPPVKTEDAKAKFEDFQMETLPSGKPYLRSVKCPESGRKAP